MFLNYHLAFFSLVLLSSTVHADTIKPFSTDGCSAFPNGTFKQNTLWLACCTDHDLAYWQGGSYKERLAADQSLKACVEQVGEAEIAIVMLAGVRVGGTPFLPTKFRWGYGWSYPKFYGALTKKELEQVHQSLTN
ncbi:MAG: hypothetical protein COA99_17725 [Moraxellaceae bacterium]|nr:MAG: hypothetical protein COA99_17725 [Moraxellaceae bacterium]